MNLKHRTRRSLHAGAAPRNRELTEHWPKDKKPKRRRFKLSKRAMKRKRKDHANKRADASTYQASLTSPWSINVCVKKGGETGLQADSGKAVAANRLPRGEAIAKHEPKA